MQDFHYNYTKNEHGDKVEITVITSVITQLLQLLPKRFKIFQECK